MYSWVSKPQKTKNTKRSLLEDRIRKPKLLCFVFIELPQHLINIKNYSIVNKILKNREINTKMVGQANNTQQNGINTLNTWSINNYRNSHISSEENFFSKISFHIPNNCNPIIINKLKRVLVARIGIFLKSRKRECILNYFI